MFMEYVNIYGLKLYIIEDWFKKNAEFSDTVFGEKSWTVKQYLAIINHWLKVEQLHLETLERGKPDDTMYHNFFEISDKIAVHSEKDTYPALLKAYKVMSADLITKYKNCKNKSTKNMSEILIDHFFMISRLFGAIEDKIRLIK